MMKISNEEMMKIFDFILENKNIIIEDNSLFNRDTLIMIRAIAKGKIPNNFELTSEQKQLIITTFVNSDNYFNEDTPNFIFTNQNCINVAIERNINSVNFIEEFTPELSQKILNLVKDQKYILVSNSPEFLKNNYAIALNSIRQEPNSANYVAWNAMKKEEFDDLIRETIKAGYELSSESCPVLTENPDIVLNSIKKNMDTLRYSSKIARNHPKVFKYLISKGYEFSKEELMKKTLSAFVDNDVMRYAIEKLNILDKNDSDFIQIFKDYPKEIDKYIERYIELYVKAISTAPTIKSFNSVLQVCAESDWDEHREENLDEYANIFGKICAELRIQNDYNDAVNCLYFLKEMQETLNDKYYLLLQAMEQYHTIIHSNISLGNIDYARDQIAKLSALYVSISKENFKKERLEEYFKYIKEYFIPRKTHPTIYKKLVEHKHKEAFRELYQNKDNNICSFLEVLVKQYSEKIEEDTLWCMIDNFLNNSYSKMDSFIKAPHGWNNYKKYEEASKLINRLNSHYIKYTDLELVRYLDIIKYDIEKDKYYYTGPSFEEEAITRYNEYRKKLQIFDKIKQQIIFEAKKLEIDSTITDEELMAIAEDLPFNDEYFKFQKGAINDFDLEDFINGCVFEDDLIEPSSLIDDEAYNILKNYVINNGLVWMLLLINSYETLEEISIDKEIILATFDYMTDIARLAKMFNYDVNKFEDVLTLCELSEYSSEESIAILGKDVISKLSRYLDYTNDDVKEIVRMAKKLVCEMTKRDKSTVPYIKGSYGNYKYSMYDSQDETILLAGINTNSCFRIDGNDNDFLHYCALDKNGFVIKITDTFGNFIGRASGFRNGNSVYINQLRTIYDEGGYGYEGVYRNEKLEIIETFKRACNDIVETSQKNKKEQDKIDFVFVTKSYALREMESNVSKEVQDKIGRSPMDVKSVDWENFVNSTENLQECHSKHDTFSTDYGCYPLICMASSKEHRIFNELKAKDIKSKDVEAVYTRPRNKIVGTNNPDIDIVNKINKINGINSYLNETDFESISLPKDATIFLGDNWYIIFDGQQITSSSVLDFDQKAKIEFEATRATINQYVMYQQQFSLDQVLETLQSKTLDNESKVLKLHL